MRKFRTIVLAAGLSSAPTLGVEPYLSHLHATADAPIFTTYAAAMERSEFTLDQGYHLRFYDPGSGIDLITDRAGDLCLAFLHGGEWVDELAEMASAPVITVSYPDLVVYHFDPFPDIRVDVRFLVYSSRAAVQEITVRNRGTAAAELRVVPFLRHDDRTFSDVRFHPENDAVSFVHEEPPDSWTREHQVPYVEEVQNLLLVSPPADRLASYRSDRGGPQETDHVAGSDFLSAPEHPNQARSDPTDLVRVIAAPRTLRLDAGQSQRLRVVRAVAPAGHDPTELEQRARALLEVDLDQHVAANEKLFRRIPRLKFADPDQEMLYWGAFSLMRQVMLPPEGKCAHNYYLFSREPTWGWGHGGQVFHESLTMLAYAQMDTSPGAAIMKCIFGPDW